MASVIHLNLALALLQPTDPHVIESYKIETTKPLSGPDFILISEAARHAEIKNRTLSCYQIVVSREKGVRTVGFLGIREELPPAKDGQIVLGFPKQNPRCPDRTFEMDDNGRVVRFIYSRH